MKKIFSILLICTLLLSCLSGCAKAPDTTNSEGSVNPNAVLHHLLNDISYSAQLADVSDLGSIYFSDLPEGTAVHMYIDSSGYHADRVAMLSLTRAEDSEAVLASVKKHLNELRGEFQNYIPEEVPKIDNAVTWSCTQAVFLVITEDTDAVNALLSRAHELTADSSNTDPTSDPSDPTEPPVTDPVVPDPPAVQTPVIDPADYPVLTSKSGTYSVYASGIMRVDNAAYEQYGYDPVVSGTYASKISSVADALAGITNVYCLPIPTAISVTLPNDIQAKYSNYHDQGAEIEEIFGKMSSNVIGVNCYPNLMLHRDEYLYFRTDYHWNGPAGYYAYESFCQVKGITPYTMDEREAVHFEGFLGALYYNHSGQDPNLGNTPDTVIAYYPVSESATMFYLDSSGNKVDWPIINDVSAWAASGKYLCYAAADQAYAEFHNPEVTDGSVLVIVKESFGNVLLSYLVDHYSVIYEIDYRYWKGNIVDFCKEVEADDLLFANNMTMISAGVLVGNLCTIIP